MTATPVSDEFNDGSRITCILNEGAPTVKMAFTSTNLRTPTVDWAAQMYRNEYVNLEVTADCTGAATLGLPVVRSVANGDTAIVGVIMTEPQLQRKIPTTASADTLAKRLAGEYYRTATVRILGVDGVGPADLVTADVKNIVPGVTGDLIADVSNMTGSVDGLKGKGLVLNDIDGTGSANIFSFHYAAKAAGATHRILCGFTGPIKGQT